MLRPLNIVLEWEPNNTFEASEKSKRVPHTKSFCTVTKVFNPHLPVSAMQRRPEYVKGW